jgi:S1-C subfamily serine protease
MEMMRRTRQMGVPVIADEQEAIVGFDVPRLKRMAARHKPGGGLGLAVADVAGGGGAKVGRVRDDSPGALVGIQPGDVIIEMSGRPVGSVHDLEQIAALRSPGLPTSLVVVRDNERHTLILRS